MKVSSPHLSGSTQTPTALPAAGWQISRFSVCNLAHRALAPFILAVSAAILAFGLCSCGVPLDSPAPDQAAVLAHVAEVCPNEAYELVSVEQVQELPQQVLYTFRSTERNLTFTALSEITEPGYGLFYSPPQPHISCDYTTVVYERHARRARHEFTREISRRTGSPVQPDTPPQSGQPHQGDNSRERVPIAKGDLDELRRNTVWTGEVYVQDGSTVYFSSYEDLELIVAAAAAADTVYQQEFAYNSPEWCQENVSATVHVDWFSGTYDKDGRPSGYISIGDIAMHGEFDSETTLDELANSYAQAIMDRKVSPDPTLPQRYFEGHHRYAIDRITVNGTDVPFLLDEAGDAGTNGTPYQRDYISHGSGGIVHWDDERESYVVNVDVGSIEVDIIDNPSESSFSGAPEYVYTPHANSWLIRHVVELAGGTYTAGDNWFSWQVGSESAREETAAEGAAGAGIIHLVLTGEDDWEAMLAINGDAPQKLEHPGTVLTGAEYVEMPVDEFAALFGMTCQVNEQEGILELKS